MAQAQLKSQPKTTAALSDEVFDVAVIGAGVVGCAMARRFTLEGAKVAVIEKATDILDGASKANSAILHTGFDAPVGSLELDCIRKGYAEYETIMGDLGLVQEKCGAFVVAWTQAQMNSLTAIEKQAKDNGISDVSLIDADALQQVEPNLSNRAIAALKVPQESIVDPWSAPYVYLRQALENGAQVFLSSAVNSGTFDGQNWLLETDRGRLRTGLVINCAGLYGDILDKDLLGQSDFHITPRKGQFVVYDKAASGLLNSIILPVPTETTKGVVLFRTVFGNLVVGPTAEDQTSRKDASTDEQALKALMREGEDKLPELANMPVTAVYAGLRPASERKEYRITPRPEKNWITVGGIRSTGLSAALGIARHVYELYQNMGATHRAISDPKTPKANVLAQSGQRDWRAAGHGEIACHCELVTNREIKAALKGPLAAKSLAGLKRQTRATMGRCQGFYCSARLAELTAGKLDPPISQEIDDA
ncbi:NAD(P)/FAD-dependent oxidoreductase [Sulfitobacter donghicola]|uniref:FAD-dependent oxidoreductase n=1 Tax=Sulfitobacter donghicola DSW-25 = KCTC 12864 = JCM 14565 TaxID=1300350 RepID=A0A073IJP7_9RHOB|nr:NAD(P)/FAD-dependent oxidoreductase [Sulfitobacter donghicola]KEJ89825.1 FAD-dependent oxidoreductase [Sulfitobacter donghicola DSW-25 = KCTC 12864 = JCM 14565]KIN67055.1 Oxidoreductase, FAD-binding [Sulfitobacter donghicola DSW-25 = KCTC 12864 = JCM 14565]